jgi:hypothetical protein
LALELLEAREVPSNSPLLIRSPYTPFATPQIVASLPQQQVDHSQSLTFSVANNRRGDSITASVNLPQPPDMVLQDDGLRYKVVDRFGNETQDVFLEGLDYNPYDDGYTSDLTGSVAVAVNPSPSYAPVAPYSQFAIADVRDEAYYTDPTAPPVRATETLEVHLFDAYGNALGPPVAVAQVVGTNLPPGTHRSLHDIKIGAAADGSYTLEWLDDTQVGPSYPTHGSRSIAVNVTRIVQDPVQGTVVLTPQAVAQSYLDTGLYGSPSDWRGDMIAFPDLSTNASGQSEVVWARLVRPTTYYSTAYLSTDHLYAQEEDAAGDLVGPRITVSQHADTYEPSPVPSVTMNDSGVVGFCWCYSPNGPPYMPLPAQQGLYFREFFPDGSSTNEIQVVSSPNTDGQPQNSYAPLVKYYVGHWGHPVRMAAAGNVTVVWTESAADGAHGRIRGQMFTGNGVPYKDKFSFVETTNPWPNSVGLDQVQAAMDANGNLVLAWGNPDDVSGLWRSVLAQRFLRADFLVQNGEAQRSTVEFLSITFTPGTVDLAALAAGGRLRLTRYDLTGAGPGTPVSLDGVVSVSGNTLTFDFGPGGLPNDGYYVLEADLDGDGVFESSWRFYRMYGDMTGTGLNNYPGLISPYILNG